MLHASDLNDEGVSHMEQGENETAIGLFDRALEIDPKLIAA